MLCIFCGEPSCRPTPPPDYQTTVVIATTNPTAETLWPLGSPAPDDPFAFELSPGFSAAPT